MGGVVRDPARALGALQKRNGPSLHFEASGPPCHLIRAFARTDVMGLLRRRRRSGGLGGLVRLVVLLGLLRLGGRLRGLVLGVSGTSGRSGRLCKHGGRHEKRTDEKFLHFGFSLGGLDSFGPHNSILRPRRFSGDSFGSLLWILIFGDLRQSFLHEWFLRKRPGSAPRSPWPPAGLRPRRTRASRSSSVARCI